MDARAPRNGAAIEEVGHYDPMVADKAARVKLDMERIDYWMGVGAQPSEKVAVLIKKVKTNKFGKAKAAAPLTPPKEKKAEAAPAETPAEGGEAG